MRRLLCAIALLALGGCATAPQIASSQRPVQPESSAFVLGGRIAVKHDGERASANVHWTHSAASDEILLLAPLGKTVARIRRDADGVTLDTPDRHYAAQGEGELMQHVLGWHLPLSGLQYWVMALPVPGELSDIERDEHGQVSLLRQDGWTVRYTRYAGPAPDSLPTRMVLQREGLEIQLLVDEWQFQ